MELSILTIGDIVGRPGRDAVKAVLPEFIKQTKADVVIANAENAAHGVCLTESTAQEILDSGVHVMTMGDHAFKRKDTLPLYEDKDIPLIRPANFPPGVPGKGYHSLSVRTSEVVVINLIGRVFIANDFDDPFRALDDILKEINEKAIVIVDFHAEATSEKIALGWHADGRVAAVLGTHTHVPTADERILPQGTAYITDIGMTGPRDGVLGVKRDIILYKFLTQMPKVHEVEDEGPAIINAVHVTVDTKTRHAISIKRLSRIIEK